MFCSVIHEVAYQEKWEQNSGKIQRVIEKYSEWFNFRKEKIIIVKDPLPK